MKLDYFESRMKYLQRFCPDLADELREHDLRQRRLISRMNKKLELIEKNRKVINDNIENIDESALNAATEIVEIFSDPSK